jgi:hypothetical protein
MFVEMGRGRGRGSEQRNAGDKENKNRNTVSMCSARSPWLIDSTEISKAYQYFDSNPPEC